MSGPMTEPREALAALLHDAWRKGYTDGPPSLEWIAAYLADRGVTLTPSLDEGRSDQTVPAEDFAVIVEQRDRAEDRAMRLADENIALRARVRALAQEGETP